MRYIDINSATEGDILGVALYDSKNRLLINKGISLTKSLIDKIKILGIQGIYIYDELSKGIDINILIPADKQANIMDNLKELRIDKTLEDAKELVKLLKYNKSFYDYINVKTFDNYTYEHSLSVSIFATIMGIALGYNDYELENLALSGLLHDLGKILVDKYILNKPEKLTDEEFEKIKEHAKFGYNMLKDDYLISATVKTSVYEHHENENGSGYPRQLKSNEIYKFAKILHIVDVYDALISKRPYKDSLTQRESIQYIIDNSGELFDSDYVKVFLNVIPAYPKGLLVKLSNNEEGIVIENYQGFILRPKIRLLNGREISLKDDENYKDIYII